MPGFERKNTHSQLSSQNTTAQIMNYEFKIKKDLQNLNLKSSTDLTPRERTRNLPGQSEFRNEMKKLKESNFMLKFQNEKKVTTEGYRNMHSSQNMIKFL